MSLLDDHLSNEEQRKKSNWEYYQPKRKIIVYYIQLSVIASILIFYLFFRGSAGSDFDAIAVLLFLIILWQYFFYKTSNSILFSFFVPIGLFALYLPYVPNVTLELCSSLPIGPAKWRWSHFELVKSREVNLWLDLIEGSIWTLYYVVLGLVPMEFYRIGKLFLQKKKSKP